MSNDDLDRKIKAAGQVLGYEVPRLIDRHFNELKDNDYEGHLAVTLAIVHIMRYMDGLPMKYKLIVLSIIKEYCEMKNALVEDIKKAMDNEGK